MPYGAMCGVLTAVAALLPAVASAKEVYTSAEVYVQGTSGFSPGPVDPDHSGSSSLLSSSSGGTTPDYFADARAIADFGGPFRAFAAVGGTASSVRPDKRFEAESSASQLNDYRVDSDTLPFGSPVQGTLTLRIGGTMDLSHAPGATFADREFLAEVDLIVQLTGAGGFYEGGAILDGGGESLDYGDLEGDFRFTNDAAGHQTAVVDVTDSITFQTTVGATFEFQLDLVAHAFAADLEGMSAEVDFYDTVTYTLTASDGARFSVVPEPAAPALALGAGLLALCRRRRR